MASQNRAASKVPGEILIAWEKYTSSGPDEINLKEGDVVELLDTNDPASSAKRIKLDPELETARSELLDSSAAKHKLSVKPRRTYASSRYSPTRLNLNARWLVREVSGSRKQGWVPCRILQSIDDPTPGGPGLPGDALFRRQAAVKELVETEQEFVRDIDHVVQKYLLRSEGIKAPKIVRDNFEVVFGNLKEIAEFHRTVLMEGVQYYSKEPHLLGKAFLRLERDFDKHVKYCRDEPIAQEFLENCDLAHNYFEDISHQLNDEKGIAEHLKLPIQRINDYQLLLKELVRYSSCLDEDISDLQKALDLMLSIPHRAQDDKFTSSIEGYRGSIHKLGRLLAHDWFSVKLGEATKERYLFLFKLRILICKVRRISEDRSIFQLKDVIRLTQVELIDHPKEEFKFELVDRASGHSLILTAHRDGVKEFWLREIKEFVKHFGESEDTGIEEFQIDSTPTELSASSRKTEALPEKLAEPLKVPEVNVEQPQPTTPKPAEPVKLQEVKVTHTKSVPVEPTKSKANPEPPKSKPNSEPQKKSTSELQNSNPKLEQPNSEPNLEPPKFAKQVAEPNVKSLEPKASTQGTLKLPTWEAPKQPSLQSPNIKVDKLPEINPATFPSITANTTKSVSAKSESGILKDIPTAKAKPAEGEHILPKIQAVEPLVHLNQPRVLEEYIPYLQKPAPEQVPGSAINKVYSVESVSISDAVLKDYSVGIGLEVNVEIDDMSRRYTSSTHAEGVHSGSSYTRRSGHTTSDGLPSSRYATESITSKYGAESSLTGGSKYDDLTSKYSKSYSVDSSDAALSSSYTRRSTALEGDNDYIYSRKSIKSSSTSGEGNGDSFSYSRRMKSRIGDDDGDYSYSKRSSRSLTQSSGEVGDNENSVYTRRSIRATAEAVGDGNSYSVRKSLRTSIEGTGIEGTKTETHSSYSRRAIGLSDKDSSYYKRSTSVAGAESDISNIYSTKSNTTREEDEEDVLSKYSRKYSRTDSTDRTAIGEEGDVYAKYTRKYSRTDSIKDDEDTKYPRRLSRTDSKEKSKQAEELEEDAYAKYANKYYRNKPSETKSTKSEEEKSKYLRSYDRTDSDEKKYIKSQISKNESEDTGNESKTVAAVTTVNGKETKTEAFDEHYATHVVQESLSTSAKMVCEKSATDKLEEVKADDRPKFIKTIRGTNIEPGESVHFDVALNERPDTFMWLKDNQSLNADGSMSGRIQWTCCEKGHEYKLLIKQVRNEDAGLYTAIASNEKGKASCSAQLVVHELTTDERHDREHYDKPEFLVSFKDTELLEDTYLRFIVKIRGEPNPEIAFFKDGVKIMENQERLKIVKEHSDTGFYELVIPEVKHSDAGVYKCIATNKWGEASCEATVTVTDSKKVFEDMPEGEILPPGEKSVFQWKKDGAPFEPDERFKVLLGDDEDSLALVFQHVRPDDVGLYTCVAQTSRGHISCSAELTVHGTVNQLFREPEKPTLIIEKKEPIVNVGGSAMLELQVKGYPKPTVKFSHNGKEIEPSNKFKFLYEDEESMSLVIKNVTSEDAGKYTVTAENEIGIESAEMTLTVKAPPSIKTKMQDLSVHAEETIRIPIEIEGIPKPTVQFYKDGKEFKKNERIKVVDEAEKHVLVIEKSTLKDTGSYSVVATNELAQVSQFWNIEIFSKPTIKEKLGKDKVVSQGENVELKLKVEAEPAPEIQWFKDEQEIKSNEHFVIRNDGDSYILKITGTVTTDASRYKFRAVNIHGSVEDEVKVDVKKAPKIVKPLQDMTVKEKDTNVTFDVKLEAFPKPTVKWYLDEVEIMETRSEFTRIESDDGAKLIIKEVNSELSGQYTCKLSNECGAAETSAKLTVNCVPRILKHLKDTTVEEGATLHLEIEVEGCPTPTVKWLRNGREVSADARIKITRDTQRHETFNLTVNLIKYEEQGEYEVVVTNTMGTVSSKSFVTVHTVPVILDSNMKDGSRPESLDIIYVVKGSANPLPTATWTRDGSEIKPDTNLRMSVSQNGEEFKLEIKKLDMKDAGVYRCTLSNPLGAAKQQATLEVTPERDLRRPKLKECLKDQTIVKKTSVTFKAVVIGDPIPEVTWLKDGKEITSDEYEQFKIILESEDHEVEDSLKECSYSLTIPRCERCNAGKFLMRAKNKWGECDSGAELTIILRPEIEGPEDVSVVPGQATEFTVVIQSYPVPEVTWTKDDVKVEAGELIDIIEDVPNETYQLIFHKVLLADEGYYKVTAKNHLGETSSEARLRTITERPKFISGLTDEQVEDRGEITVMVRADGLPKPHILWYCNGKELAEDEHHKIERHTETHVTSSLTVSNYNEADVGFYKAVAVNVVGEAESTARITMLQTPPSFGKRLERSEDVNEGEPLELKAKVGGSPKPQVSWFKDGEPIPENDPNIKISLLPDGTVKLNIEKAKPEDSGAYKLVIRNSNGETACLCAVAVTPKAKRPKFLKCFKDMKVPLGQPLRLEAKVEAYPPPEIKWVKDGLPVRASSNIRFENHPDGRVALIVDCLRPENAGSYRLILTNKLGETTGEAEVEIEKKPRKPDFIQRLVPQTVVEGFPVKFEVKAEGFPVPTIKWLRNDAEVISDSKHIKIMDQPDGTSILLLDAVDEVRDALTYKAVASNEAGHAETYADLTVKPAAKKGEPEERPVYIHSLKDVITDEGQALIMEAPFTGNPIPSVDWTKDGKPIQASDRVLLTCDGRKVGIKIDHAVPSDAGVYGVTISNPLGKESTEGKVTVHKVFMPPSFTQKFTDLQQLPDRDAKFPYRVTGVPQPEVSWSKDGVPLKDSGKYRIRRDGDAGCLYVLNCEPNDAGVYRATATSKEGQDICTATLEVVKEIKTPKKIEPPVFLKRIGDTELFKAMTAKFTACASGSPDPTIDWYHNDQKLFPSNRIRMEKDTNGLLRLTILGVDQDDLGKYTCKITNEHGSDICHAQLKFDEGIEPKPKRPITDQYTEFDKYKRSGAPMPLSDPPIISQMTDRHCTLSWKPSIPSAPRIPVTYQLEMCELPHGDWFTVRTGIRSCTCGVRNLEPFRDYKFRVRVENKYGISDPSPYAITHREKLEPEIPKFRPYLPPEIDFRPETSPYFPKDFDIERPPHDNMAQAPRFLRQEHDIQYGVKDQNTNLFWFVYGYPKPKVSFYFNDELIESGGRFDMSYTRNGQATLFINKMLERDVGWYEAVARNEHGEARQRVRLEIAEPPYFIRRPEIEYVMLRGKARFEARIIGVPFPNLKWYKDWKPVAPSSRIKIIFTEPDTTVLMINDIILKDEGLYSVSARNVAGSASSSAMLHIEENDLEYSLRNYTNLSPIKAKKRVFTDAYDIGDELGRGTQGVTYHAAERINGRNYAAKIMHGRDELRPFMYNELEVHNELRHKKLISLHDAYDHDDSLTLVLELASGGELVKDYLLKQEYYTESDIAGFIRQLLQGLQYMHERGYGHMGLNLGDLLISHPGGDDLKITDFGLSRRIAMGRLAPLRYGVPEYVSPEAANGEGTGLGHDIWSVGIITYILLSGRSPFRGLNDMETLTNVRSGKWVFDDEWWSHISTEARDFISKLLVYQAEGRLDVHSALRHPWLERADKRYTDEYRISTKYLSDYWKLYREWYDNASCKKWYRRRPLEGAFTHPSKMVYPPGEYYSPRTTPLPERTPKTRTTWEDQLPSRSPLNYEIGVIKSESHYQNGPDTYLLQLRDVDFPVRLREYMKVATNRGPGAGYIMSDENGYDWRTPIIHERRRFTDIMDEEIDDERRTRINRYGTGDTGVGITRRLKHELGSRLDTYVEAEAFLESKQEGRLPFFREKPYIIAMQEGHDLKLSCFAVGEPQPIVQWFKSDAIIAESHRIKIITDAEGRSQMRLSPALAFDQGMYKIVARNKVGQTVARTRIVMGLVPDEPDSPEAGQISDTEILLTWKQPKFDGNSPVLCYCLEYKLADDMEWKKKADNIDHEFYLMTGLEVNRSYLFRLAAKNSIGWSEKSVPSAPVMTKTEGSSKVQLGKAMRHLQQITDSGAPVEEETSIKLNYAVETQPIEWENLNSQDLYNFISEISRGRFSAVVKAVEKSTDTIYVAKLLELSPSRKQDVEGEFAALRSLRHERIAGLVEAYRTNSSPVATFILEKLQGADILTYLASRHEYTEQTVATIVSQVLDGLQYLHWRGLCHLDLQPDNIVMSGVRSVSVKLVDFGCAHRVTKLGTKVPVVGHRDYISPEVLAEELAIPQTDIWTVGVLTYVMLSGSVPFKGEDENETRQNILFVRYRFEHLYQEISQEATRFIMLLFKRQPNKRPTADDCHENRWLLPTDHMIKKRERAIFLGNRIKEYSKEYHVEKAQAALHSSSAIGGKFIRSQSIHEELLTVP